MKRVGIDIGGTFTDLCFWDAETGELSIHKIPTSTSDPSEAGTRGLVELCEAQGIGVDAIDLVVHGTTVATNIALEKDGAKVGLITTRGFRDLLHIGRKNRPYNFSHYQDVPRQSCPIIQRRHRLVVDERIAASGEVLRVPDLEDLRTAVHTLVDQGVEAIAVCLLFSFKNPDHEKAIRDLIHREFPQIYLSVSHEISPLYREYERFSTTALNAFVGPRTAKYLGRFSERLSQHGVRKPPVMMSSSGGCISIDQASRVPVSLLLSGPVGALLAGVNTGRQVAHPNVITLDVGGTSTDVGVAPDGQLRMKNLLDASVGGYDLMMPMVDIETIGAGGGSIAYVDSGGMFRVGPQSAGAVPGPACYDKGGQQATVTDALCEFRWLRPEALSRSGLKLAPKLASTVIEQDVAGPLGLSTYAAAAGVYRLAVHHMVDAIRVNSIARGLDPREFALIAYGGAGASFVSEVARELGMRLAIVPRYPGVGAAQGLLEAEMRYESMLTAWIDLDDADYARIQMIYENLRAEVLTQFGADGFDEDQIALEYEADCRYRGQGYELTVTVPATGFGAVWGEHVREAFHRAHEDSYARRFSDTPVRIINVRVCGFGQTAKPEADQLARTNRPVENAIVDRHTVHFPVGDSTREYDTPFYERSMLMHGDEISGPAIVEQSDTTTIVMPGDSARVDSFGNLILDIKDGVS